MHGLGEEPLPPEMRRNEGEAVGGRQVSSALDR